MLRTQQSVSRRAIVLSNLAGVAALTGAGVARQPTAGRGLNIDGTPATASPLSTPIGEAIEITIAASTGLRFSPSEITIPAHTPVRIVFINRAGIHHDLVIPKLGQRTPRIGPDETRQFLEQAEPESYRFYCSIPSHTHADMEGTIIAE